jgi:hypothetical protein
VDRSSEGLGRNAESEFIHERHEIRNKKKKKKSKKENNKKSSMNVAQVNKEELDIDLPNAKLAYTIIQSLLQANESLSDLLVVMAHALDEDVTKALTLTGEWQKYLESKRELEVTKEQIEKFTETLKGFENA